MLLADEFFFLALDDFTGRMRLSPRVLGLGLAGALLGELILEQRIRIREDRIELIDWSPPPDALTHTVQQHLAAEREIDQVRTWLDYLSQQAREQVAQRLWRAGRIHLRTSRRLLRVKTTYPPVDMNVAATPAALLATALRSGRPVVHQQALLAGLAVATGLDGHVLSTGDAACRAYLRYIVDRLPPSPHELVWHLHAAVGDAVLTGLT